VKADIAVMNKKEEVLWFRLRLELTSAQAEKCAARWQLLQRVIRFSQVSSPSLLLARI
jgi:hypothetical protein